MPEVNNPVNIQRAHPPQWFRESDFGIFIHWGISSVPAFAPVDIEDYGELARTKPPLYMFQNMPYAEWYPNALAIPGSPAAAFHKEHYGDQPYHRFAEEFKKRSAQVDVEKWADLFKRAGAHYVVVVTKHHDGFLMFNSRQPNPHHTGFQMDFDHVGNLAQACRSRGMRFGTYYSSLLDWTFTSKPITSYASLFLDYDNSQAYRDYCYNHWLELIERYQPDILWSDIGYPADSRLEDLFAHFYREKPDGLVNDRWGQWPNWLRNPLGHWLVNRSALRHMRENPDKLLDTKYYDYRTLEYTTTWQESDIWFEVCRGMDKSFGYNQFSREKDFITSAEVLRMIAEIYPKKGRLLLNVGPDSYGNIPPHQVKVLEELAEVRGG